MKTDISELIKENKEFTKANAGITALNEELNSLRTQHVKLRETATAQEDEIDKFEKENTLLKKNAQVQEEDLDKFEAEIIRLRDEVSTLQKQKLHTPSGGGNSAELDRLIHENKELRDAKYQLQNQAAKLAEQLTVLCDQAERAATVQQEKDQLDKQLEKVLTELDNRELELEQILADHDQLVNKLASFGVNVQNTDQGLVFSE